MLDEQIKPERIIQDDRIELMIKMNNYDKIYHSDEKYIQRSSENYFRRHSELLIS